MNLCQVAWGFFVSTIGGAFVLWLLIDKVGWSYLKKQGVGGKPRAILTPVLGIVERGLYTGALLMGAPEWIAVWLALKVAVAWRRWEGEKRGSYNLFLIGSALSVMFGVIGAWIALGRLPSFAK